MGSRTSQFAGEMGVEKAIGSMASVMALGLKSQRMLGVMPNYVIHKLVHAALKSAEMFLAKNGAENAILRSKMT